MVIVGANCIISSTTLFYDLNFTAFGGCALNLAGHAVLVCLIWDVNKALNIWYVCEMTTKMIFVFCAKMCFL